MKLHCNFATKMQATENYQMVFGKKSFRLEVIHCTLWFVLSNSYCKEFESNTRTIMFISSVAITMKS